MQMLFSVCFIQKKLQLNLNIKIKQIQKSYENFNKIYLQFVIIINIFVIFKFRFII